MFDKGVKPSKFKTLNFNNKSKKKIKILFISSIISLFFSVLILLFFYLITKDDYFNEFIEIPKNSDMLSRIATSVSLNEEVSIKFNEINPFLNFLTEQPDFYAHRSKKNIRLEKVNLISIDSNKVFKFYLPTIFNEMYLGIVADSKLCLSQDASNICFELIGIKIGKMPIPKKIFLNLIKSLLPENWIFDGSKIIIPSNITLNLLNSDFAFNIKKFDILENELKLKIEADKKTLGEFLSDQLKKFITGNVKNLSLKFL